MIISVFSSASWQIDLAHPYLDANDVTSLYPSMFFVFARYSVKAMNIDRPPEMCVVYLQLMKQSLDEPPEMATIQ
jgi:hypothetical protein